MGGDGQKSFGPKIAPLVVGSYCIQHKGIYLSSLVKKYEQTGGRRGTLKILSQLKLRTKCISIACFLEYGSKYLNLVNHTYLFHFWWRLSVYSLTFHIYSTDAQNKIYRIFSFIIRDNKNIFIMVTISFTLV